MISLNRVQQCEVLEERMPVTANISVAMRDRSPPKSMHKLFKDALCFHVSVDGYLWSGFNSAKLSTIATLTAPYGGIWQVGLKKADKNIWLCNG
nr:hypothetical protein CFP56_48477 [Quercus suber]